MATIEKRQGRDGKDSFRAKVRLRGYPAQSATFERLTDAKKWIQDTESAIREGRYFKTSESKKHNLSELLDRYLKEIMPQKPKSLKDQVRHINWWKNNLGSYLLSDITPAIIVEYRSKLLDEVTSKGTKRTSSTANRYIALLSSSFTTAVKEWGWTEDNPVLKIKKLKEPRGIVRYLSDEERNRLLQVCRESGNELLYLLVVLALSTGARRMEILGLEWEDIDIQRKQIILHRTKNDERRSIPLIGLALELMIKHSRIRRINTKLAFPGKNPSSPIEIRKPWVKALEKSEIENFRWHDLRHSTASYLAMNGASLAEIAAVLGHKTLSMVKRYSHLSDNHTAGVVEKMNNKIFGGKGE